MDIRINLGMIGTCGGNRKALEQAIRDNLEKELKKTLTCCGSKHAFVDANDGTGDKVCVVCGIRAMQAVMRFSE